MYTRIAQTLSQAKDKAPVSRKPHEHKVRLYVEALEQRDVPASGLVAAYNFDAGAGAILADLSGNGNNGSISGATWSSVGKYGKSLSFSGASARVNIPDAAELRLTDAMTLEAWVRPTSVTNAWRDVISKGRNDFSLSATSNNGARPVDTIMAGGTSSRTFGTSPLPTGTWSHLAATFDGTTLRLYVNGTQVSGVTKSGTLQGSTNQLTLGGNSYLGRFFKGYLDDVRIYNVALSRTQIQTDMNTPVGTDTTAPTVAITGPGAGSTVAGLVNVTANASDNVGVVGVQFYLDGAALGAEDTVAPYAYSWNTANASNGSHTLTAKARDAAGNATTSTAVQININNSDTTAPTVNITTPANGGTVAGSVNVAANAADNVGVVGVQFYLDGVALGSEDTTSPYSVSWNTANASNGSHTLTAKARDAAGNLGSSSAVQVTVNNSDTTAPTVNVTAPTNGTTVSSTVNVTANASDNVGVVGVQFFLDGVALGAEDTSSPYAASWNTTTAANGNHTLTAKARDAAGNATTSSAIQVNVNNSGSTITVSTVAQLVNAVNNLQSGQTIVMNPGTYQLTDTLWFPQNRTNITLKGATGNRDDVVIRGNGMAGSINFGIWTGNVQTVTFSDFTIRDFVEHGIILNAGTESPTVRNLHVVDIGDQFVKANPDGAGGGVDNGLVENCLFEYTTQAPDTYTNGVDVHGGQNWVIRGNTFRNFKSSAGLAGPALLMWNGSSNTLTERNTFINNQRDIAYGLVDASGTDHSGGIIRNNIISRTSVASADVAIGVYDSPNTQVVNNTVRLAGTFPNAVEYRFAGTTGVVIRNNLTDAAIVARDGATGTVNTNVTNAQSSWFVNAANHDLHLLGTVTAAIDKGATLANVPTDFDGQTRPTGAAYDIGADEYVNSGDSTAPSVNLTAPTSGSTVSGSVNVTANATDNVGVVGVQFFLDGTALGAEDTSSPYAVSWNTTTATNGSHTLTARARDAAGNTTTSSAVTVTVSNAGDTTPPTVSVTAPANNATVSNTVNVTANAADNVGVVGVQFFLDGNLLGGEDMTAPYGISWNTATTTNGTHNLTAKARDAAGNTATSASITVTVNNTTGGPGNLPLINQNNLSYLGAFTVPKGAFGSSTFAYGGTAIAFNPVNNSLFMVGHDWDQAIAEIKIPTTLSTSGNWNNLPTAAVLQPFQDVQSRIPNFSLEGNSKIGGLQVINGQLYGTFYEFYDGDTDAVASHFRFNSTNLSSPLSGLFQVGNMGGGYVGGYMAPVPAEWQPSFGAPYMTGQAALAIIGRTSSGPAAFGFDPQSLGSTPAPAIPYVYYPLDHQLGNMVGSPNWLFNGTTEIRGMTFIPGTRTVLFYGSNGTNSIGYGMPEDFNDNNRKDKTYHSQNGAYSYEVWAYDANDFLAVKNGTKQPWEIRPYTTWFFDVPTPEGAKHLGGVAFDPATNRLYVSQLNAGFDGFDVYPIVQVYQVSTGAALTAASIGDNQTASTVSAKQAHPVLQAAIRRWADIGADISSLNDIKIVVTDLQGSTLAMADTSTRTILVDTNAAGHGWFIDRTPQDDSEFCEWGNQGEQGRMDLLSTLVHEVGHMMGLGHEDGTAMSSNLGLSQRLLLTPTSIRQR